MDLRGIRFKIHGGIISRKSLEFECLNLHGTWCVRGPTLAVASLHRKYVKTNFQ